MGETYDAVLQAFGGGYLAEQLQQDCTNIQVQISEAIDRVRDALVLPSVLYRPTLMKDGDKWLAIYGDLPTGCVGSGDTPEAAMDDFNLAWRKSV